MNLPDPDRLHRTLKLEMDDGRAGSLEEARAIASSYVLQVDVGNEIAANAAMQAALLTVVNTGARAFLGGVKVRAPINPQLLTRWARGESLRDAVSFYGGEVVTNLSDAHPTIILGDTPTRPEGSIILHATWGGWSGGVVIDSIDRLPELGDYPLPAILSGAMAVSESFQFARGNPVAGNRPVGLSLWKPEADWRSIATEAPACSFLPSGAWILGLGHLGQAYCWCLGFLPYSNPEEIAICLQDFDRVVEANAATALLADHTSLNKRKTRVVAARLEGLGFDPSLVERPFDRMSQRLPIEPGLALGGFDRPEPRRALEDAGFDLIIDAGIGGGPDHYLDILIHSFPSGLGAEQAWPEPAGMHPGNELVGLPAYDDIRRKLIDQGVNEEEARCGVLQMAGRTVAASFVGIVAGCLVLAEALRYLCGGPRYQVVSISLRSPEYPDVAANDSPGEFKNIGYVIAEKQI